MVPLIRGGALAALLLLASCGAERGTAPTPVHPQSTGEQTLFPKPYFPVRELAIEGHPVATLIAGWTTACLYVPERLTEAQRAWVATLQPAGGEGSVGLTFTRDFDHDGKDETVSYGAYAKENGNEGNFLLVTRRSVNPSEVLLLKEIPGPPEFTVFTLKPDGSLWFGGGIDAGEVTMKLVWDNGAPVFSLLSEE